MADEAALVPQLVAEIAEAIAQPARRVSEGLRLTPGSVSSQAHRASVAIENLPHDWPRPTVAFPPWETATRWLTSDDLAAPSQPAALPKAA